MGRSARYQTSSGFIAPRSFRGWVGDGCHDGGYSPRSDKLRSTGMLIEIGSTPKQWTDPVLGGIVAKATVDAIQPVGTTINTVGFGGTHYSAKHTKLNLTVSM